MDNEERIRYDPNFRLIVPKETVFFGGENVSRELRVTRSRGQSRTPVELRPTPPFLGSFKSIIHPHSQEAPSKAGRKAVR